MKDDAELVAAIRGGAPEEFTELVRRHQSMVFSILGRYERDAHRVEDLAQVAFVKAWRALERFDGRSPFSHWLARITTRVALDHLRRARRDERQVALEDLGPEASEWLQAEDSDEENSPAAARELLDMAMAQMSPEDRVVLTMMELEEQTVEETARTLGWTGVRVRVRAYRARKKLARIISALRKIIA